MRRALAVPSAVSGTLRLGVAETIVHTWLARFIERVHALYPDVTLEIEVDVDKAQLQNMLKVIRETELQRVQGFSHGPVVAGKDKEEREANLDAYTHIYQKTRAEFAKKNRELSRERRRVASLEERTKRTAIVSDEAKTKTFERILDQILREIDKRRD